MNWLILGIFLLFPFSLRAVENSGSEVRLCGHFYFRGPETISLSETERRLVCGDPKNEAWDNIPISQATFNLRNFFEDRGFYHPTFQSEGDKVFIDLGKPTTVSGLVVEGQPPTFHVSEIRRVVGERLTPALLNQVRERFFKRLQSLGYACPEVAPEANADTGILKIRIKPGALANIIDVTSEPLDNIDARTLRRYDAFQIGDLFNNDYLDLSAARPITQGTLQSTYFTVQCTPEGAKVHQKLVAGPPRLVTIGFGVNTERYVLARAAWKHLRLGDQASLLDITADAALRGQTVNLASQWYLLSRPSRFHLRPSLTLKHEDELETEVLSSELQLSPAATWDTADVGITFYFGPKLTFSKTLRGTGANESLFVSFASELRLTSHYFELYRGSPREGFDLDISANLAEESFLSPFSARQLRVTFEKLWNINNYEPPFAILGVRAGAATTLTSAPSSTLPTNFQQFLGGASNLRGFSRLELPGDVGGLTSIFASVEARFADLLPYGLQPFAFVDAGMIGAQPLSLDPRVYYSPGIGLRWQSSFGVFRVMLAHGYVSGDEFSPLSHWKPYLSFGEEF